MQTNSYNIGKTLAIIVTYTILCKIILLLQKDEYLPCAALAHYPQVLYGNRISVSDYTKNIFYLSSKD